MLIIKFRKSNFCSGFETVVFGFWLMMMSLLISLSFNFIIERKQNLIGDSRSQRQGVLQLQRELQAAHSLSNAGSISEKSHQRILFQKRNVRLRASEITKGFSYDLGQ